MGILQAKRVEVGDVSDLPGTVKMVSTDNLATITAAGYLNSAQVLGVNISPSDIIQMLYSYVPASNSGTFEMFTVTQALGVLTLVPFVSGGNVLLPVVSGNLAVFNGTAGQIKDSGAALTNSADAFVVSSPGALTAGNFPQLNDANGTLKTGLPPSATGQAYVVVSPGSLTIGDVAKFSDVNGTLADTGILATNLVVKNAVNTMAAGSSIVLAKVNGTESGNAVTASGVSGVITTSSLSAAGGASYAITWTNTFISATSTVLLSIQGGTNTTENITLKVVPGAGSATLTIYNNTAATALNGTILIGYAVF